MKSASILTCIVLLLLILTGHANAQFGLGGRFSHINENYWHETFSGNGYPDQIGSVSAMYWFRLKNKRVEFLPEAGYSFSRNKEAFTTAISPSIRAGFLQVNTNIYFLDFDNDCNCPTFSKQGDLLQRGLFAEFTVGVEFRSLDIDYLEMNQRATRTFHTTTPKFQAGLGFDIGLSDMITITPVAGVTMLTNTAWDGLEEFIGAVPDLSDATRDKEVRLGGGLRVLFRPDYVSGRRR